MVSFYLCSPSWEAVQDNGVLQGPVNFLTFATPRQNI